MKNDEFLSIVSLIKNKQYSLAEKKLNKLIKKHPTDYKYQNILAIIYLNQNKIYPAIKLLENIIMLQPNFNDAYINLATILDNKLDDLAATKIYTNLIVKQPNNIDLLILYCNNLISNYNFSEATNLLNDIINLNSTNSDVYLSLGINFLKKEQTDQSLICFKKAIELNPYSHKAYSNMGFIYLRYLKNFTKARNFIKHSIKLNSSNSKAYYNLGCVFNEMGKKNESIPFFKKALEISPDYLQAKYNLSLNQLATDDFENGWLGYEVRKKIIKIKEEILGIPKEKIWDGKQFESKLIVHAEQGLGDEVLISSIYEELSKLHSNLLISCDERLINIFQRSFPKIKFFNRKYLNKDISGSKHIFSFSLGQYFRKNLKSFDINSSKWLLGDSQKERVIKSFFPNSKKIKIGISWKSTNIKEINKNIPLLNLINILPEKYFEIINLQYGDIENEQKEVFHKTKRKLIYFKNIDYKNDLESLIAIILNCDLVITSSNVTAHFAGALGKKTFLLLPVNSLWYWQIKKKTSIWYPSINVYRQIKIGNWDDPINKVKSKLITLFNRYN